MLLCKFYKANIHHGDSTSLLQRISLLLGDISNIKSARDVSLHAPSL